jgi:hypothetical protein
MIIPLVIVVVMVAVIAVSAAFRLEGGLHLYKKCSEAMQHILDHVVGPNAKNFVSNFGRQMAIPKMPSKAHKLIGIFMPDFDNKLSSGLNLEPPPIVELQAISIRHCDRFRKIEENLFALVSRHPDATAMAPLRVERQSVDRFFFRPMPGGAMDASGVHLGIDLPVST